MPHTRNTFERVDFVAAVKELYTRYMGNAAGKLDLLGFKLVVILPFLEKTFEKRAVSDTNLRSDLELGYIETPRFSQGARLHFWLVFCQFPCSGGNFFDAGKELCFERR